MIRVLSATIAVVLFSSIVILIAGYFQPVSYTGELKEFFAERRPILWQSLTNLDLIEHTKPEVVSVEILSNNRGLITWRENLKRGHYRVFEIIEKKEPFKYVVELKENSKGLTGTWVYFLEQSSESSIVTIQEESENTSIWMRGIDFIRGRDVYLKKHMKTLRVALFRRLIDSP